MPAPDSRKIWTAIPDAPYAENGWDNFTTTNAADIEYLMNFDPIQKNLISIYQK